jgi:hypothetical protein
MASAGTWANNGMLKKTLSHPPNPGAPFRWGRSHFA